MPHTQTPNDSARQEDTQGETAAVTFKLSFPLPGVFPGLCMALLSLQTANGALEAACMSGKG